MVGPRHTISGSGMKLTEKQEHRIARHLQEVAARLANQSPQKRQEALARLRERIRERLKQLGSSPVRDQDVEAVLKACGGPVDRPARPQAEAGTGWPSFVSWPDRVLLGVCAGLAKQLDVPPAAVRTVVVILALIPPFFPAILGIYLGAFFAVYFKSNGTEIPSIEWLKTIRSVSTTSAILLALFLGTAALLWTFAYASLQVVGRAVVLDERWAWFQQSNGTLFFWALLFLLPLTILSTLPVPAGWDTTLRKIVQAGMALYALVLCYGIATVLVGIILRVVEDASGPGGLQWLTTLLPK